MSRLSRTLTLPLRLATAVRRADSRGWPSLPRPALSVGNLALGGRCKTPLVAALTAHAIASGFRPAILLRGYPRVLRRAQPRVLTRLDPPRLPWTTVLSDGVSAAQSWTHALTCGDEAAWLAAVTGVPVGAHPDRVRSAAEVLRRHPEVDLLLLDDGLQTAVRTDVEIVLVDPLRDLGTSPAPGATREGDAGLPPGAWIVRLGPELQRTPGVLRDLAGRVLDPAQVGSVTVCAGVGDPASVAGLARDAGLSVIGQLPLRDHRAPTARQLAGRSGPFLITEKDAVGWAAGAGRQDCVVLGMGLTGAEAIWDRVFTLLGSQA